MAYNGNYFTIAGHNNDDKTMNIKHKFIRIIIFVTFILGGGICKISSQPMDRQNTQDFMSVSKYHLPEGPVRFLEDNKGHLIITVTGKEGLIGIVRDTSIEPLVTGYISDATLSPDGNIWYIGKNKISSVNYSGRTTNKNFLPLFFKDNIPDNIAFSKNPLFYRDRLGSIWLDNAPYRVGADMKILPNPKTDHFTCKFPLPLSTDPFGNMWGLIATDEKGIKTIGILPSGESKQWTVFDEHNGFHVGQWSSIIADIEGIIWASGRSGLIYFDPRKPGRGWSQYPLDGQYQGGVVSLLTLSSTGHALSALQSGELFELNIDSKDVPVVKKIKTEGLPKSPFDALYTDRAGRIWIVVNNNLYRQDKKVSEWQMLTPMPYGNHDLFGVELNGKIYTPGGGANHGFPVVSKNFDCLLIYDIQTDRWEISSPMSTNRRYCSAGLLDGKIWVIGGFNKSEKVPEKEGRMWNDSPVNTVEIYDPVAQSWSTGPSLDVPRAETVACTISGRLYVFGSTGNDIFNTLSIGPGEKQWRIESPAPYPVFQTTGCVLNNQAYIMSGNNGLLVYDPESQTWQNDLPPIPGYKPPFSSIVVSYRNEIWVISGRGNFDGTKAWIYSPQEKIWRAGPSLPYPTMWANGIEVNGRLYIFGGATISEIRNTYVYWDVIRVLNNN